MTVDPFLVVRRPAPTEPARRSPRGPHGRKPTFSRAEILDAIRDWAREHGAPPAQADWDPGRARRLGQAWRAERFEAGRWPTSKMVRSQFGALGLAIEAAGFERPRKQSAKPHLRDADEILRAVRGWTLRYGEPPTNADWDPARARALSQEWRELRYRDGDWPSLGTVRHHFGSLTRAIAATGLAPTPGNQTLASRSARRRANLSAVVEEEARRTAGAGPHLLGSAMREVATARKYDDAQALHQGLLGLASAALAWAEVVRWSPEEEAEARLG